MIPIDVNLMKGGELLPPWRSINHQEAAVNLIGRTMYNFLSTKSWPLPLHKSDYFYVNFLACILHGRYWLN